MTTDSLLSQLIRKYDVPVPRYTSYPTVPHWDTASFHTEVWKQAVIRCFRESNTGKGISLYIHLPFCESLCTYCACNTRITRNHAVEDLYIQSILKEWHLYLALFTEKPVLRELHLGGGTPTFFSPQHLRKLIVGILDTVIIHPEPEFSFEGHPNNTTEAHLQTFYELGFRRVSYGVQDLDINVQTAIHRIQPFERVEEATRISRAIGYESVNFDLIFGLPYQTIASIRNTVEKVVSLRPDRIAFYSYAHVPWIKPGQRGYEDADLPTDVEKRALYETGKALLEAAGYVNIGMDHFALPGDALTHAHNRGMLHRNFMGYTTTNTDLLIGLGTSAISDARYAYAQNEKKVEAYRDRIDADELATVKGHVQTSDDMFRRSCILAIACQGALGAQDLDSLMDEDLANDLATLLHDGLIQLGPNGLTVTSKGTIFIRNICSVFDLHLRAHRQQQTAIFSRSI